MQRDIVAVLVGVDTLDDINLTNRILVKVVRPAKNVRNLFVSSQQGKISLGRPDTTCDSRHMLNISDQNARAVRLLGLKTNASTSMLGSPRCEKRRFVDRVHSKENLAVIGIDDTGAHCLTSAQVVDGATSRIALIARVDTIKVGTLQGVNDILADY